MKNNKPYLSICIPTFNRSQELNACLESLIMQPELHTGEIEVVVSDNYSTDNTNSIVEQYIKQCEYIHFFKNPENIRDKNFPTVLSRATGIYRKLSNDSLIYEEGSLKRMLEIVKENMDNKPVLFFDSNLADCANEDNLDVFLERVSFQITSIASYGVWEDDFTLDYYGCEKSLWQVPHTIDNFLKRKKALIISDKLFHRGPVKNKDVSYGLYHVFYENYLGFMQDYCNSGTISKDCYDFLKKDLLMNFFSVWVSNYLVQRKNYIYNNEEDLYSLIKNAYKKEHYYPRFLIKLHYLNLKKRVKSLINGNKETK